MDPTSYARDTGAKDFPGEFSLKCCEVEESRPRREEAAAERQCTNVWVGVVFYSWMFFKQKSGTAIVRISGETLFIVTIGSTSARWVTTRHKLSSRNLSSDYCHRHSSWSWCYRPRRYLLLQVLARGVTIQRGRRCTLCRSCSNLRGYRPTTFRPLVGFGRGGTPLAGAPFRPEE